MIKTYYLIDGVKYTIVGSDFVDEYTNKVINLYEIYRGNTLIKRTKDMISIKELRKLIENDRL